MINVMEGFGGFDEKQTQLVEFLEEQRSRYFTNGGDVRQLDLILEALHSGYSVYATFLAEQVNLPGLSKRIRNAFEVGRISTNMN